MAMLNDNKKSVSIFPLGTKLFFHVSSVKKKNVLFCHLAWWLCNVVAIEGIWFFFSFSTSQHRVIVNFYLTLCCLKKVFIDMHAKPIWLKICLIFVIEPPANRMDMQRRKFPAGSLVPGIFGWLCHVDSAQHPGFVQTVVMTALVPIC